MICLNTAIPKKGDVVDKLYKMTCDGFEMVKYCRRALCSVEHDQPVSY